MTVITSLSPMLPQTNADAAKAGKKPPSVHDRRPASSNSLLDDYMLQGSISTILLRTYAVLPAKLEPILYPTGLLVKADERGFKLNTKWLSASITLISAGYSLIPVCVETLFPATPTYLGGVLKFVLDSTPRIMIFQQHETSSRTDFRPMG